MAVKVAVLGTGVEDELRALLLGGAPPQVFGHARSLRESANDRQAWRRYRKLASLAARVAASCGEGPRGGDVAGAVLRSIEGFVITGQRWLKIAGGSKAELLEGAMRHRPLEAWEAAVELGSFVGYTAVRLGRRQASLGAGGGTSPCVMSCEYEMVHACLSRGMVDLAGLGHIVEIWPGHVPLITPRLLEHFGAFSASFQFMDHKGTRFHEDRRDFEAMCLDAPQGCTICDNVVHPGAPEYLWSQKDVPGHCSYALGEFAQPELEDWQSWLQLRTRASCRPALQVAAAA